MCSDISQRCSVSRCTVMADCGVAYTGVLWKHTEYRTEHVETRRSRRLVVSFFATIANYGKQTWKHEIQFLRCVHESCLIKSNRQAGVYPRSNLCKVKRRGDACFSSSMQSMVFSGTW